jgi:hypothetical protein
MLDKPEFDCANLGEFYDCGCNGDEEGGKGKQGSATSRSDAGKDGTRHDGPAVEISKEELVVSWYCCLQCGWWLTFYLGLPAVDRLNFASTHSGPGLFGLHLTYLGERLGLVIHMELVSLVH